MATRRAREIMMREIICVSPETPLEEAWGIMTEIGIRHIPVLEDHRLVGILSDRDLLPLCKRDETGELMLREPGNVASAMTRKLTTRGPRVSVRELADIMLMEGIDSVPIVADGELVGLVTSSDLLALLAERPESGKAAGLPFEFNVRHVKRGSA